MALRFGKLAAQHDPRTLMLHRFIHPDLPPPPESYNGVTEMEKHLGKVSIPEYFPMDGNNRYGDCVVAGCAHAETLFNGLIGKKVIFPESDVVKTYLEITGGEDNGLVMLSFLKYWKNKGINGHKIAAFARISSRDHENIRRAICMLGGAYLGFNVQQNAISDFEHHKIWEPGPPDGGHCVHAFAFLRDTYKLFTWGDEQEGSKLWMERQADEIFGVVPFEAEDPKFYPGLDFAGLMDAAKQIGRA